MTMYSWYNCIGIKALKIKNMKAFKMYHNLSLIIKIGVKRKKGFQTLKPFYRC